jgi:hypothetical protein
MESFNSPALADFSMWVGNVAQTPSSMVNSEDFNLAASAMTQAIPLQATPTPAWSLSMDTQLPPLSALGVQASSSSSIAGPIACAPPKPPVMEGPPPPLRKIPGREEMTPEEKIRNAKERKYVQTPSR